MGTWTDPRRPSAVTTGAGRSRAPTSDKHRTGQPGPAHRRKRPLRRERVNAARVGSPTTATTSGHQPPRTPAVPLPDLTGRWRSGPRCQVASTAESTGISTKRSTRVSRSTTRAGAGIRAIPTSVDRSTGAPRVRISAADPCAASASRPDVAQPVDAWAVGECEGHGVPGTEGVERHPVDAPRAPPHVLELDERAVPGEVHEHLVRDDLVEPPDGVGDGHAPR